MTQLLQRFFRFIFVALFLLLAVFVASTVMLNATVVTLELPLVGVLNASIGVLVVTAFVFGVLVSLLFLSIANFGTQMRLHSATKKLRKVSNGSKAR